MMPAAACEGRHGKSVARVLNVSDVRRSNRPVASDELISEQMPRALEFGHGILVAPHPQV
jgi:hypothetical protein